MCRVAQRQVEIRLQDRPHRPPVRTGSFNGYVPQRPVASTSRLAPAGFASSCRTSAVAAPARPGRSDQSPYRDRLVVNIDLRTPLMHYLHRILQRQAGGDCEFQGISLARLQLTAAVALMSGSPTYFQPAWGYKERTPARARFHAQLCGGTPHADVSPALSAERPSRCQCRK
jgi:hypothetical protein